MGGRHVYEILGKSQFFLHYKEGHAPHVVLKMNVVILKGRQEPVFFEKWPAHFF